MKAKVIDIHGKEIKEIELNDFIFNIPFNSHVVYEAIKNENANKRQGTASTKTKAEVRGTGAKPYRQKGTGRARVGTRQNPVWRGGGVAFGPKPRDYSYKLPKKIKQLAYRTLLSERLKDGKIKILENIELDACKTKEMVKIFKPLVNEEKTSVILQDNDNSKILKKAGKNIAWLTCLNYNRLNIHSLFYSKNIIITEDAVNELNSFFQKQD
jgi:large subunit ribosomal protein L4